MAERRSNEPICFFGVKALAETQQALLCVVAGRLLWIQRKMIKPDSQVKQVGDYGMLWIPEWLADHEELVV